MSQKKPEFEAKVRIVKDSALAKDFIPGKDSEAFAELNTQKMRKPQLKSVSDYMGPGPKMCFAMDTRSKQGYLIIHLVQFHTLQVKDDGHFDQVKLQMVSGETDARLSVLASLVK